MPEAYQAIFDATEEVLFIHDPDTGRILGVNPAFTSLYGYSREEALGLSIGQLSQGEPPYSLADARAWIHKTVTSGAQCFEWLARDKRGRLFWVEVQLKSLRISGQVRLLSTVRDISGMKAAEERQRRREELLRAMFENVGLGMALLEPNGQILIANSAFRRMLGYRDDAPLPQCLVELAHGCDRHAATALLSGSEEQGDVHIVRKDGDTILARLKATAVVGDDGRARLIVLLAEDVTGRKELEERQGRQPATAEQPGVHLGLLAGSIAHGLNNALTPVLGYVSEARALAADGASAFCLDEALKSCAKARELVSGLLILCRRGDAGRTPLHLAPAVESALHVAKAVLPPGVDIQRRLDCPEAVAVASLGDVHELVLGLCEAAARTLPSRRGRLDLRLAACGQTGGWLISVAAAAPGQGLSLAFPEAEGALRASRELARALGGGLEAETGPAGLELSVSLPKADLQDDAEHRGQALGRVLFIDDDTAIGLLVGKQLESSGFAVTAVSDPGEALRCFRRNPRDFDCVITDLLMPGLSGLALAQRIRELRPEVPVLLCSGNCALDSLDQDSSQCFDGYVPKPFTKREMIQAVQAAMRAPGRRGAE